MDISLDWILQRVGHPHTTYILNKMLGESNKISIGRKKCNIICEGKRISHTHCELEFNDEQWFVKDLKSRNGVFVNKTKIPCSTPTKLKPGDILGFGSLYNWVDDDFIFELFKKDSKTTPSGSRSPKISNSDDVTRKTDNQIRLEWAKKLNDKKLAAQSVVLLEKISPCTNNYSNRSLRMEHDCKADPLLQGLKPKKRKRTVRRLILSDDDDSDSEPKGSSTQHSNNENLCIRPRIMVEIPVVDIPVVDISSDSDVLEPSENLIFSFKGKTLKKPSHNQDKTKNETLSPSGNNSGSSSFQSDERSPDVHHKDQLPSTLSSSSEDEEDPITASLNKGEVSYRSTTGKRSENVAKSASSESSSSSEESSSTSSNTSEGKPRKTRKSFNEVVECLKSKPKEKSAQFTAPKPLLRGHKRLHTASFLPTPNERENYSNNRVKKRRPKKSTGFRGKIQPEMVSFGASVSQATSTGYANVSTTPVQVYGAEKTSAAPSISATTRPSAQAVKVKVTTMSRSEKLASDIPTTFSQMRSANKVVKHNPSLAPTIGPSSHANRANAQSSNPRTAVSRMPQNIPTQRRRSYRDWNDNLNPSH